MSNSFDPYEQWLGIPPAQQPAHYYRLLGLQLFESDPARIQAEADARMQHVRKFQLGQRSQATQTILNELAAARVCLLSVDTKSRYDAALSAWLTARLPVPPPVLPPEAPLMLPPDTRALLPGESPSLLPPDEEDLARLASRPDAIVAAPRTPAKPGRRIYAGWLLVAGVVAMTAVILVLMQWKRHAGRGTLDEVAERGPPPTELPESHETGDADLTGKTVKVPAHVVEQSAQGNVDLQLGRGKIHGPGLKLEGDTAVGWHNTEDQMEWEFLVHKPGSFQVFVTYAADAASAGREMRLTISGQTRPLIMPIRNTGGPDKFARDVLSKMVQINKSGRYTLTISPVRNSAEPLMMLRGVQLERAPTR